VGLLRKDQLSSAKKIMEGIMRPLMRTLAAGITLIVIFLLPLALFAFQVGQILYSPQAILNLVAVHIIGPSQSNLLTETLLRSIPSQLGIDDDTVVGKAFIQAAEQTELQASILPSDLQLTYAAQGINAFYSWLEGPDPLPVLALDMNPIKDHMGQNMAGLVQTVLEEVPTCTAEESLAMASDFLGAILSGEDALESMPACLPEIVPLDTIAPAASALVQQQVSLIPETIILDNLVSASPETMIELKERLQLTKGILLWSWLPFVFLLLIAAFVGGETRDGVPRWLGWSLIVTGFSTFLFSLIPASWWVTATAPLFVGWLLLFRAPALLVLGTVYNEAQQPLIWFALGMAILGIALLLLAAFLKRGQSKMA
jgi:hypothetical protein